MDAASEKADAALEARSDDERATGEASIGGPTVDSPMRDIYARRGLYDQRVDANLD